MKPSKEKRKEYNDRYILKNKEKLKEKALLYREANQDFVKERRRFSHLKIRAKDIEENPLKMLFLSSRNKIYKGKWCFELDYEFIKELWERQGGKCYYTNLPMTYNYSKKSPFHASIDRKDSTIGYTKENSVLCCLSINYAKNSFTEEQLQEFLKAYKEVKYE